MDSGDALYDQLTTKKISDAPSEEVNLVTQPLHLEKANKGALETTVLINNALLRSDSGPIPGTLEISTVNGGTEQNVTVILFTPQVGEIYQVLDIAAERDGSGTVNYYVVYYDNEEDTVVPIIDLSSSDGAVEFEDFPHANFYIDSRVSIAIYYTTSATVNAMAYRAVVARIR